jgi:protein phosphatase
MTLIRPRSVGIALEVRGISDVGKSRSNNEDALSVADVTAGREIDVLERATSIALGESRVLLAVSDGMGGENAGEVASALVLDALRENLSAHASDDDCAEVLAAAVRHANARVFDAASEPGREGMGATLVAVVVAGTTAITAEIGDSRIYLFRGGLLSQVSKDQTHLQLLLQSGLSTADLRQSRAKNIVLQACGKAEVITVAQRRLSLCNGDRLLLCSDGLTLHIEDSEIEALLERRDASSACEELVKMANDRGGKDNVTVLIADIVGGAAPTDADELIEVLREYSIGDES